MSFLAFCFCPPSRQTLCGQAPGRADSEGGPFGAHFGCTSPWESCPSGGLQSNLGEHCGPGQDEGAVPHPRPRRVYKKQGYIPPSPQGKRANARGGPWGTLIKIVIMCALLRQKIFSKRNETS